MCPASLSDLSDPMVIDAPYSLGLSRCLLPGRLLRHWVGVMGSAESVWKASDKALRSAAEGLSGSDQSIKHLEKFLNARTQIDVTAEWEKHQKLGIQLISLFDTRYPALLRETNDAPFLLYVIGNLDACKRRSLAVVGTRRMTDYGERVTTTLIQGLKSVKPCIISGMASGIDTVAHLTALENDMPTVAVFGTPVNERYPSHNAKLADAIIEAGGALVSEYPLGMPYHASNFPKRNRIIAGMSEASLVVEGPVKSGSLITAKYALEENRQVLAVPGNIFSSQSSGPNTLIASGAVMVQQVSDILETLGWEGDPQQLALNTNHSNHETSAHELPPLDLPEAQRLVFNAIGTELTPIETIQEKLGVMPIHTMNQALTMLELAGLIRSAGGARFCRS